MREFLEKVFPTPVPVRHPDTALVIESGAYIGWRTPAAEGEEGLFAFCNDCSFLRGTFCSLNPTQQSMWQGPRGELPCFCENGAKSTGTEKVLEIQAPTKLRGGALISGRKTAEHRSATGKGTGGSDEALPTK